MRKVVVVGFIIVVGLPLAGCEQCVVRPCGFCYDSIISAAIREPAADSVDAPAPPAVPPPTAKKTAPMLR